MASKWINVKGEVDWAHVYEPDEYPPGNLRFKVDLYPEEAEWKKIEASGLQLEPKEGRDGKKYITLRRQQKRVFPKDDEATYFNPPEITGAVNVSYVDAATGAKVRSYKKSDGIKITVVGEQIQIGNNSKVIANINVYDTSKGAGHRLESLNVLDLVEFTPSGETSEEDPNEVEVIEAEAPVAEVKKTTKATKKEDMNDAIPW